MNGPARTATPAIAGGTATKDRDFGRTVMVRGHRLLISTFAGLVDSLHTSEVDRALARARDIVRDLEQAQAHLDPPGADEAFERR